MNGNCGVCGLKASCICPEHGERCDAHVPTHAYCPQLRPMCVSCGAPVPEGGEGVPELCGACCAGFDSEPDIQAALKSMCQTCGHSPMVHGKDGKGTCIVGIDPRSRSSRCTCEAFLA